MCITVLNERKTNIRQYGQLTVRTFANMDYGLLMPGRTQGRTLARMNSIHSTDDAEKTQQREVATCNMYFELNSLLSL